MGVATPNPNPCTGAGAAQAWAINDWIAYHLLLGVEHIDLLVENNSDNLLAVLEPWGDYVTTRNKDSHGEHGWKLCFEAFKHKYKWVAFMDIDEFLNPLKDDCLHQVGTGRHGSPRAS